MFVEAFFFFLMIGIFWAVGIGRDLRDRHRDHHRHRWVAGLLPTLIGRPVEEAIAQFGPPFEVLDGSDAKLYCWKSPPSDYFPTGTGLLIVDLVVDAAGTVTRSSWHVR